MRLRNIIIQLPILSIKPTIQLISNWIDVQLITGDVMESLVVHDHFETLFIQPEIDEATHKFDEFGCFENSIKSLLIGGNNEERQGQDRNTIDPCR